MKHTLRFLGSLVLLVCIITVAYAADQAINARTELDAAPAENDILPIYDTDATAGKRITVLNLLNALEAALTDFAIHTSNMPSTITGVTFDLGTPSVGANEIVTVDADGVLQMSTIVVNSMDSDLASVSASNDTIPSARAVKQKIQYKSWSFDPKAVCDGAVDRLFLMSAHGGQGVKITQWKISFEADPTTEVDLDLKRADAWIGVANSAVMDILDTTAGAASEAVEANINANAAVAEGKVIYLEFGTAYVETTHQIIFEMWFYEVGN